MSGLTKTQRTFCDYYARDFDLKEACLCAGIKEPRGKQFLDDPECRKYIAQKNDRAAQELGLSKRYILSKLMAVAERAMQAEPVMKFDNVTKEYVATGEYTFDGKTATQALKLLGEHLDVFDNPFDFVAGSQREAENAPMSSQVVIVDDIPKSVDVDELADKVLSKALEDTGDYDE